MNEKINPNGVPHPRFVTLAKFAGKILNNAENIDP